MSVKKAMEELKEKIKQVTPRWAETDVDGYVASLRQSDLKDNDINIIPSNDTKKHIQSKFCDCIPRIKVENGIKIIIHNAYDGRV